MGQQQDFLRPEQLSIDQGAGAHVERVVTSPMPAESSSSAALTTCKPL